jgi:hypothetical protein
LRYSSDADFFGVFDELLALTEGTKISDAKKKSEINLLADIKNPPSCHALLGRGLDYKEVFGRSGQFDSFFLERRYFFIVRSKIETNRTTALKIEK